MRHGGKGQSLRPEGQGRAQGLWYQFLRLRVVRKKVLSWEKGMLLTSIITDGRFPVPPTSHLAGAIDRAPEIVTIITAERDLVTQIVVGGPGPVFPVLKVLWSGTANCFGGGEQVEVTETEGLPFRISLLVSGTLSLRNSAFSVLQDQLLPLTPGGYLNP